VPPGLTGLAQVMGSGPNHLSAGLDRCYVTRQSWSLDVRLVAVSFAINAFGKARVRQFLNRYSPRPKPGLLTGPPPVT
jgi:lipopolysaccharide/colanic/teichoic acid biosynthesis glycosyltransferase